MNTTNEVQQDMRVSDLIGGDYLSWPNDAKIEIVAGTGRGKSYWAINIFIKQCYMDCRTVLFACNRHLLYEQIRPQIDNLPGITVTTYQALQDKIAKHTVETYDVIIADEAGYFLDDAGFNKDIDLSYNWLINQKDSQIIFMDANGGKFFDMMKNFFSIPENQIYTLPKSYDYVDAVYFYELGELEQIVDNVLSRPNGEKALVFVKSMKRLEQLREVYGDKADYYAGTQQNARWLNKTCIFNNQFSKRILFTTTALGYGVDIKDEKLKTIVCELFDIHGVVQAIGRKRPLHGNDTCSFYFCNFWKQTAWGEQKRLQTWIHDAQFFLCDKVAFRNSFLEKRTYITKKGEVKEEEPRNYRQAMQDNPIFCADPDDPEKTIVNSLCLEKCKCDSVNLSEWLQPGVDFKLYLFSKLGDELKSKERMLIIADVREETFNSFLRENCETGTRYFRNVNLEELRDAFRRVGLEDTDMGIHTLNGKLKDLKSSYTIKSKRQNSRNEPHYKKTYWYIDKI